MAESELLVLRELFKRATGVREILEVLEIATDEQLDALHREDDDKLAPPGDERVYSSAGLTPRQEDELDHEWLRRARAWVEANRLPIEEALVRHTILPRAIRERWKVDGDRLAELSALLAVFAVDEFLGVDRSQVKFAADTGMSRRAWQKTWGPRFDDLYDDIQAMCVRKVD